MAGFCDEVVLTLEFVPVDVEAVSSFISALHIQKASGADGLCAQFIRASPCMARLVTVFINECILNHLWFLFNGSRPLLHQYLNVSSV